MSLPAALRRPAIIRYYFDLKSPFSFLSYRPTIELERDFDVRLQFMLYPFPMREAFGLPNERNKYQNLKVRYGYRDARRYANERGLTLYGPKKAFDSSIAMCGSVYALQYSYSNTDQKINGPNGNALTPFHRFNETVFERFFKRSIDIESSEVIRSVLNESGIDIDQPTFDAFISKNGEGRKELQRFSESAEKDGVFGVPFYWVVESGEPFFGNDRIDWLRKYLTSVGLSKTKPNIQSRL